jgi:bifunctional non-homologous end joining protein LigD
VRPKPAATVSAPVTWQEVERGVRMEGFTMKTVPSRLKNIGDLWKPLLLQTGRTRLENFL